MSSFERSPYRSIAPWIASRTSARGALIAAGLAVAALVFGALTAHIPGANAACQGFPLCRGGLLPTRPAQHIQFVHRLIAFALFFHLIGLTITTGRRGEKRLAAFAKITVALCLLQILVAAAMVELQLPPVWRSMHEAVGTLLWIAIFLFAIVARRTSIGLEGAAVRAVRPPVPVLSAQARA